MSIHLCQRVHVCTCWSGLWAEVWYNTLLHKKTRECGNRHPLKFSSHLLLNVSLWVANFYPGWTPRHDTVLWNNMGLIRSVMCRETCSPLCLLFDMNTDQTLLLSALLHILGYTITAPYCRTTVIWGLIWMSLWASLFSVQLSRDQSCFNIPAIRPNISLFCVIKLDRKDLMICCHTQQSLGISTGRKLSLTSLFQCFIASIEGVHLNFCCLFDWKVKESLI